jgi:hypothetical protein
MWTPQSPLPQHHCQDSVSLWACRVREGGRGREREIEERGRERESTFHMHISHVHVHVVLLLITGMLVNDSLGRQIMKLQQLILTSEVGYSIYMHVRTCIIFTLNEIAEFFQQSFQSSTGRLTSCFSLGIRDYLLAKTCSRRG